MAQNSVIEQAPLFETLPVGQEIIFIVSNETAVINELRVKFIVDVHISEGVPPDINTTNDLIGTFKVTPNNAGRGVIDLSTIVGNYVSADNMAVNGSSYKGQETADRRPHPLHLIDKYSLNNNIIRYMRIKFTVEYLDANGVVTEVGGTRKDSELYIIWNAYLKETDELIKDYGTAPNINWFGWNPTPLYPDIDVSGNPQGQFLTNAPTVQYANPDDYGTFGFITRSAGMAEAGRKLWVYTYNSGGVQQSSEIIPRNGVTGSYNNWSEKTTKQIGYVGAYPANLRNWASDFKTQYDAGNLDGGYYTVQLRSDSGSTTTKLIKIYLNCPNTKGYESIRLCWLNQWGAWDYYTFTQKSIRSISTKGSTYRQLGGNWSGNIYYPNGYKGGKKDFTRNATEVIKMNTDFISEDENVMFEELMNSPEIYILKGYEETTNNYDTLNRYVTPVRLKGSSFTRKTVANDRLIQYTFEIEKSKTLRTQSI